MTVRRPARLLGALALAGGLLAGCGGGHRDTGDPATETAPAVGSVWVANDDGESLSVINAATGTVAVTLTGLDHPHNVQVGRDGITAYAVQADDTVVAIDAVTYSVNAVAHTGAQPAHVIEAPNNKVYVTGSGDGTVAVFTAGDLTPIATIALGGAPHGLRAAADGSVLVVANTGTGALDLIDPGNDRLTGSVPVGSGPVQVAVSPDGRYAYAGVTDPPSVVKVDLTTRAVVGTAAVPAAPVQLYLTPDAATVLSANEGTADRPGKTVSLIDTADFEVRSSLKVGAAPHGVVVDDAGRHAWVSNTGDDTVSVLTLDPAASGAVIPVGAGPTGISYSPFPPTEATIDTLPLEIPGPAE